MYLIVAHALKASYCLILITFALSFPIGYANADAMNAYSLTRSGPSSEGAESIGPRYINEVRQRLTGHKSRSYQPDFYRPAAPNLNQRLWQNGQAPQQFQRQAANYNAPLVMQQRPKAAPLESLYSKRILEDLEQFGYEFLASAAGSSQSVAPLGIVGSDYILGPGDEITITLTGQRNAQYPLKVDTLGQIHIPGFQPLNAAGLSIAALKMALGANINEEPNQELYISLSKMRALSILIAGHVKQPGRLNLTHHHSIIDALIEAGGIKKTGSLRQIRLVRNGQTTMIDLYALLMHGHDLIDLNLKDGDRLIVPPIGPTLAVAGDVKRPGIYEILPLMQGMWHQSKQRSQTLALSDLLTMSGGLLTPGKTRYIKLDMDLNGDERVTPVNDPFTRVFGDGSILSVQRGDERRAGSIEVTGHSRVNGVHALKTASTLNALLTHERILGKDIYPLIAIIERWSSNALAPEYVTFSPILVLTKQYDAKLQDGDVLHFFSHQQIAHVQAEKEKLNTRDDKKRSANELTLRDDAYQGLGSRDIDIDAAIGAPLTKEITSILKERSVFVRGAIRRKGHYPVAEGATLENILAVAGGITIEADKKNIEITAHHIDKEKSFSQRKTVNILASAPKTITIQPGDTVRVNQKFKKVVDNHVQILGEVASPGRYDLMPGDTLLSLINRAGGLSEYAYAKGAIFSRKSERLLESQRYKTEARSLELNLSSRIQSDKPPSSDQVAMTRAIINQLESTDTVGRITVEANPDILKAQPALDMLLESGDRIYIPKRPLTVRVAGEVLSPASLQFRSNKKARNYVSEAGGYTRSADKSRVFVVYPDGSAQPLHLGNWNHAAPFIPPGSTIIIPHDPKPFSFLQSAKDITQIITNLAVTGFLISEIQDDD